MIRIEHWTNAAEQGAAAARNLLAAPGEREPYAAVPYFWSDQYDVKIQAVGLPARAERMRTLEATPDGERVVLGGERDGRLVAAIALQRRRGGCRSTAASSRRCRRSRTSSRRSRPTRRRSAPRWPA